MSKENENNKKVLTFDNYKNFGRKDKKNRIGRFKDVIILMIGSLNIPLNI